MFVVVVQDKTVFWPFCETLKQILLLTEAVKGNRKALTLVLAVLHIMAQSNQAKQAKTKNDYVIALFSIF